MRHGRCVFSMVPLMLVTAHCGVFGDGPASGPVVISRGGAVIGGASLPDEVWNDPPASASAESPRAREPPARAARCRLRASGC
jgi:hypothetical protein